MTLGMNGRTSLTLVFPLPTGLGRGCKYGLVKDIFDLWDGLWNNFLVIPVNTALPIGYKVYKKLLVKHITFQVRKNMLKLLLPLSWMTF